ncbi:MAG: ATP-binding cassette domain-containing protein [Clostridia bacterium]
MSEKIDIREENGRGCLLKVENLSKHYIIAGSRLKDKIIIDAVKNISFEVFEGDSLGLIGESGSGKSTAANMIMRLIEPSDGRIFLFGKDITTLDENGMRKYRKDLQIIFQHSNSVLDPKMTIGELLSEPLKIHGIVKDSMIDGEVDRLLGMVGLSPAEKSKFPGQMSGGQVQRVIIARAISTRPRIIICDEPVSALDVSVQGQILNLLKSLKDELGLTYVFISHDLKVVRFICNRIAVMRNGKIVEMGTCAEVLGNPAHSYTKQLMESNL